MESMSKGEQTRRVILNAAHQLFTEQGFHGTSMRQISDKADITLGGIYNHFSSKEEIFLSVLIEFHPLQKIFLELREIDSDNLEDSFHQVGNNLHNTLISHNDFFNLLFIELVEFKAQHVPDLFTNLFPKGLEVLNHISSNKDEIREIPSQAILASLVGVTIAYFTYQNITKQLNVEEASEVDYKQMVDIILHGIMKEQPEAKS